MTSTVLAHEAQPEPLWPGETRLEDASAGDRAPCITPYPVHAQVRTEVQVHDRSGNGVGAVVVCPGGGYSARASHEGEPVARWLNTLGVAAFVLDYRVAPHRHPVPLGDAQRAMRYVRHHARSWGVDPDRVGVLGFSAGGHLASSVSTHYDQGNSAAGDPVERQGCRPDLAILCYPVITFGEWRHHGSMVNLLGEDPPETLRHLLSNETQVTPETPPTFLWHTADDAGVPVENSLLYAAALRHQRVPVELHVFPTGRHGLGLAQGDARVRTWTDLCATWLAALGWGTAR